MRKEDSRKEFSMLVPRSVNHFTIRYVKCFLFDSVSGILELGNINEAIEQYILCGALC